MGLLRFKPKGWIEMRRIRWSLTPKQWDKMRRNMILSA